MRQKVAVNYMRPWQRQMAAPYAKVTQPEDLKVNAIAELTGQTDRSLLIVEDDRPFLERLARAMEIRGFDVTSCESVSEGLAHIGKAAPAFAGVDLGVGGGKRLVGVLAVVG